MNQHMAQEFNGSGMVPEAAKYRERPTIRIAVPPRGKCEKNALFRGRRPEPLSSPVSSFSGRVYEHLVDNPEGLGFLGLEESVAVHRLFDFLEAAAGELHVEIVQCGCGCAEISPRPESRYRTPSRAPRPKGWCTHDPRIGAAQSAYPAHRRPAGSCPMLRRCPMHTVDTRGLIYCMVSINLQAAVTTPPGELIYM